MKTVIRIVIAATLMVSTQVVLAQSGTSPNNKSTTPKSNTPSNPKPTDPSDPHYKNPNSPNQDNRNMPPGTNMDSTGVNRPRPDSTGKNPAPKKY